MAVAPAQTWGTNWQTGVQGAGQKYTDAVQATTKDPTALAIAQQAVLLANFTAKVTSGEWARRLSAVGASGWKSATLAKAANWTTGATAGLPKFNAFAQQAQPYWQQLQAQVDTMPAGTRAASIQRFTTWMDGMTAFAQQYNP